MPFLEERFPIEIDYGSSPGLRFANTVQVTGGGNRYVNSKHPYVMLHYELGLRNRTQEWFIAQIQDFYLRARGEANGFRIKNHADYTTNAYRSAPTFADQPMVATGVSGQYQITRWYGDPTASDTGRRRIRKPVAGTVIVGITDESDNDVEQLNDWSVDPTTGLVTFAANQNYSITAIDQAVGAEFTIGSHTLVADDTFHVDSVVGMTEVNGLRATVQSVTATTVVTDLDTSAFTAYSSGGDINTRPQTGEVPTAGCEFDVPVWFETALENIDFTAYKIMSGGIAVQELLNP